MQTQEGRVAAGNVASEEAAFLQFCALPCIQADLASLNPQVRAAKVTAVSEAIHVPEGQITWPVWISRDNASTFPHGWNLLQNPREPTEATVANLLPQLRQAIGQICLMDLMPGSAGYLALQDAVDPQVTPSNANTYKMLRTWYLEYCSLYPNYQPPANLHRGLQRDTGLLHVHQAMPLGPNMPECHSMIEHAIGTAKAHVKMQLSLADHSNEQLLGAKWYQDKLQRGITAKLSGEAGKNHVKGSVQKWKFCVQVVAADKNTTVHVEYPKNQYSNRGRGRPRHQPADPDNVAMVNEDVSGTAGDYPPANLC